MAGFGDHCKAFLKKVGRWVRTGAVVGWGELKATAAYYWAERGGLWGLFTEYVTFFKEHGTRKEIRLSPDDDYRGASFDGSSWRAELPDCCAVCGEPAGQPWSDEERTVPVLNWPLGAPLAAVVIGFVLRIYFGARWLLPISVLAGLWLGYRRRAETPVRVRFRRCAEHVKKAGIPRLRFCKGLLVIDVGHRAVYRKFWEGQRQRGRSRSRGREPAETDYEHLSPIPTLELPDLDIPPIPLVDDEEISGTVRAEERTLLGSPPLEEPRPATTEDKTIPPAAQTDANTESPTAPSDASVPADDGKKDLT